MKDQAYFLLIRFDISCESSRGFTWNIKLYFLQKIKVKKLKCRLLQFLFGTLKVKTSFCSSAL